MRGTLPLLSRVAADFLTGRTTITIAHRLSTIKDANRIHVMGEGLILESGTHTELLRDENGPYARLVAAQKLKESRVEEDGYESSTADDVEAIEKAAREEIPLQRRDTGTRSLASEILEKSRQQRQEKTRDYNLFYLFKRIGSLNPSGYRAYLIGTCAAICAGMVYPAFGLVYSKALSGFSLTDPRERRHAGDRNALWSFIIAILSAVAIAIQNWMFNDAAAQLAAVLRNRSFKAILSQDIEFFDREENNTGALTTGLSGNPQKIFGLAGITLGAYVSILLWRVRSRFDAIISVSFNLSPPSSPAPSLVSCSHGKFLSLASVRKNSYKFFM